MTTSGACSRCGAALPASATGQRCPKCLLQFAFDPEASAADLPLQSAIGNRQSAIPKVHSFGDYQLLEEIARGGMGVVWKARQVSLNRTVAVKLLLAGRFSSAEYVKRFRAEAEAAAHLQHPNIVAIHEVGAHEGQHYFSMDYVEGGHLGELVRDGPLPAKRAAAYLKTTAEAVHYAHERGVLHRDLKPSNILIDPFDQPRVSDFGLAKQFAGVGTRSTASDSSSEKSTDAVKRVPTDNLTLTGQFLGTPNYMPPEQAAGAHGQVGPAGDVHSLGAILYHLLTGRPPFLADTMEAILLRLATAEPVAPRLLNPNVPRDLETICLKCLEKSPLRRYVSARALAEDLGRFLQGEPIRARPAGGAEKLWRWCRRKPALAASFALLAVIAVGATLTAVRFGRMRDEARHLLYVADMNVALRDLQEGNAAQAVDRLKRHMPEGGQADLRGFEWRYLWRVARGSYSQWLPRHRQVVGAIQFSPDGRRLATYTWDDTVRVWDLAAQRNLFTAPNANGFGGFSTNSDEVVLSRRDGSLQFSTAGTGATNRAIAGAGELVAFSAESQTAVTLSRDAVLTLWNVANASVLFELPGTMRHKLESGWSDPIILSPKGTYLAMIEPGSRPLRPDRGVRLWDLKTRTELPRVPANRQVRCLEFSPDESVLAIGDGDGNVVLWRLNPRESVPFKAHEFPVLALAFSPDGRTLATGSSDEHNIRLWDATTGDAKSRSFSGQIGDVWALAFSPDGKRLASGTRDGPIRLWNLDETDTGVVVPERLHADQYGNFFFSPDSKLMAGGCADHTVKVWEVATLRVVATVSKVSYVAAFSADSRSVLVSASDGTAKWSNLDTRNARPLPRYEGNIHNVDSVDLSPDGRLAALGLPPGPIQLLDFENGRAVGATLEGHTGAVHSVAFTPSGDKLASGGSDRSVRIWDTRTGRSLAVRAEHKGAVCSVAVSPDGRILASGCGAGTIKLWNLNTLSTGSVANIVYHKSGISALAFSPDGKTLASGSDDRTVKLWNLSLRRAVASFKHESHLRLVTFAPDGNTLATVTDQGTLRVFRAMSLTDADRDADNPLK